MQEKSAIRQAYQILARKPFLWMGLGLLWALPSLISILTRPYFLRPDVPAWLSIAAGQAMLVPSTIIAGLILSLGLGHLRSERKPGGLPWMALIIAGISTQVGNVVVHQIALAALGPTFARLGSPVLMIPLSVPFMFLIPAIVDERLAFGQALRYSVNATVPRFFGLLWIIVKIVGIGGLFSLCLTAPFLTRVNPQVFWNVNNPGMWAYLGILLLVISFMTPLYYLTIAVLYDDPITKRMAK